MPVFQSPGSFGQVYLQTPDTPAYNASLSLHLLRLQLEDKATFGYSKTPLLCTWSTYTA